MKKRISILSILIALVLGASTGYASSEQYYYSKYDVLNIWTDDNDWVKTHTDTPLGGTGDNWGSSSRSLESWKGYTKYKYNVVSNDYVIENDMIADVNKQWYGEYTTEYHIKVGDVFYKKPSYNNSVPEKVLYKMEVKRISYESNFTDRFYNGVWVSNYFRGRVYYGDVYKKDANRNTFGNKKILIQSDIKAPINTYPKNGPHTDGYWYIMQGVDGASVKPELNNLSEDIKKDIMPVITVTINTNFKEPIAGRTYITSGSSSGGVTISQRGSGSGKYAELSGRFTTEGTRVITITDRLDSSKKASFIFDVIQPSLGSVTEVQF